MDPPGSPAGSVVSEAGEKKAKLPAAIAKAGKEELQKMLMDTLKKLKIRDKKLTEATSILKERDNEIDSLKQGSGAANGSHAVNEGEVAELRKQLAEAQEAAVKQHESDKEDAKAMATSTRGALLAAQQRSEELENMLRTAQAEVAEARAEAEDSREQVAVLEEQVASFKMAVNSMAGSADAKSEGLQSELAECRAQLKASVDELEALGAELEAAKDEASSAGEAYERLADANEQVRCMEEALHESNECSRKKVAELEAALEEVKAEHAAALEAHAQLEASQEAAAGLTSDREAARALVKELEASLSAMQSENARLLEALETAQAAAQASAAGGSGMGDEAQGQISSLHAQLEALRDENERLIESEAQTSDALSAVRQKYVDQERVCAQFAVMENSMEASVEALEQRAEDAEEMLQGASSRMETGSSNLLAALAAFEQHHSKAFSAALGTTALLDAYLQSPEGEGEAPESPTHPEAASLQSQLSVLQGALEKEIQARTNVEQKLVRAEGQLEGAIAANEQQHQGRRGLRVDVSRSPREERDSPRRRAGTPQGRPSAGEDADAAAAVALSPIVAPSETGLGDCGTPELQAWAQQLSAAAEAELKAARAAVQELEALRGELEEARREAAEERAEAEALADKIVALEDAAEAETAAAAAEGRVNEEELTALRARVSELEAALEQSAAAAAAEGRGNEEELTALRARVSELEAALEQSAAAAAAEGRGNEEELTAVRARVSELEAALEELRVRASELEQEKAAAESAAEALRSELGAERVELSEAAAGGEHAAESASEELGAARRRASELLEQLETAQGNEEALRIEMEDRGKELEAVSARVEALEAAVAAREKELADSKKKFLSVAKKKQAEYISKSKEDKAKIEELESLAGSHQHRASEAEAALEEARGQVRIREKELARLKEDLGFMEEEASNAKMHSSGAVEQLRKDLSAKEYEATTARKDLEEAQEVSKQTEKQLDAARAKAREEREALTARLEEEVERMEKSHAAAVAEMKAELQAEHESDMEHLRETHKVAAERLKASLEAAEKEATEANEAAIKAETALEEAGSSAKDASAAAVQQKGQLEKDLDAANAQVEALKKEHDSEREKMKKAVADYKKKADRAERGQRKAEVQAAEMRGKAEAEKEVLRGESSAAGTQVALAKEEVARVEGELHEYRQRAHALLQRKEEELRRQLAGVADGADDADGLQEAAREAQEMLKQAREERDQMARSLEDAEERWATEAEELRSAATEQQETLRRELSAARQQASRSTAAADDLQARCAALEEAARGWGPEALEDGTRGGGHTIGGGRTKETVLAEVASQQVVVHEQPPSRADQAKLKAIREEFEAFRETSMMMSEAKDAEVEKLLEANARLREELREARERDAAGLRAAAVRRASTGTGELRASEDGAAMYAAGDEGNGGEADILRRRSSTQFGLDWPADDEVRPTEEWDGWARGLGEGSGGGGDGHGDGHGGEIEGGSDLGFGSQHKRDEASLLEEMLGKGGLEAVMGDQAQLFKIAERQALRDDELNSVRRRAAELEDELLELRREVELREEQDRVLKDALRESEAQQARREATKDDFDMEYLKNVVIQFVCTRQQEALLPVVAQVLHLSPSEMDKCSSAMRRYKEEDEPDIVNAASDYLSSTASWLGSGWLGSSAAAGPPSDAQVPPNK